MAKKKAWRGVKPKSSDQTADEIRKKAGELNKLTQKLLDVASDMDAIGIPALRPRPAKWDNSLKALRKWVRDELQDRLAESVEKIVSEEHAETIRRKHGSLT